MDSNTESPPIEPVVVTSAKRTTKGPKTVIPKRKFRAPPRSVSKEKPIPPISPDTVDLCDPCQVRGIGTRIICGWQGASLSPHLKSHRKENGDVILSVAAYKTKYPNFSVGRPSYTPTEADIARILENNTNIQKATKMRIESIIAPELAEVNKQEALNARFEELWSMCERDPAAKVFCLASAQDESLLQDARARAEKAIKSKKHTELRYINQEIKEVSERYEKTFRSLSLTVEQRRKTNQLGSDPPSQIISNYGNTLRKWSLEKVDAFARRVEAVRAGIAERVRVNILEEIEDKSEAEGGDTEIDYKAAIARISHRAG